MTEFRPAEILKSLLEHHVRFVVIGGLAAELHGAPIERTVDLDITPASDEANLERLAVCLRSLGARLRALGLGPQGIEVPLDARTFSGMTTITFITKFGPFDIALLPDGTTGFDDLACRRRCKTDPLTPVYF
ncbi:MAG: hypothetical protein ACRDRT_00450 [Pseudonocardiaceae bacterium]